MNIRTLIETRAAGLPNDERVLKGEIARLRQARYAMDYFGDLDWDELELVDLIGFGRYLRVQQYLARAYFQNERYSAGFYPRSV